MMTKHYRFLYWLYNLLSFTAFLGPTIYFVVDAYNSSTLITEKVTLTCTILMVTILTLISIVNKVTLRSKMWILLFGLYLILDSFMLPVLLIGGGQIIDELFLSPLAKHYKNLYTINREIDRRG